MKEFIGTKIVNAEPAQKHLCTTDDCEEGIEGYKVVYPDGYESWSPKEVFEKAYKQSGNLSFGDAIHYLKLRHKVARKGWNGKGIFLELQVPDKHSKMTSPYIYIDTTGLQTDNPNAPKSLVPWLASQTDMLADDWCIIN